jgi:hypothetical protein
VRAKDIAPAGTIHRFASLAWGPARTAGSATPWQPFPSRPAKGDRERLMGDSPTIPQRLLQRLDDLGKVLEGRGDALADREAALAILDWLEVRVDVDRTLAAEIRRLAVLAHPAGAEARAPAR